MIPTQARHPNPSGRPSLGTDGAGLARHLTEQGVRVVEVNRPDRRQRRATGQSDPLDAYAAAGAMLPGRARAIGGNSAPESSKPRRFNQCSSSPWVSRRRSLSEESLGADAGVGRPA